ncbi:MAG: hypothetical protein ACRCW9_09875 [Cetobacterium sp.]
MKKTFILNKKELNQLIYLNEQLNDFDYKIYSHFISKFYSNVMLDVILESVISELQNRFNTYSGTEIKINKKETEETFEYELIFYKFNNKELIQEKIDSMFYTEQLIIKKIFNDLLTIDLKQLFRQFIIVLQEVFKETKDSFFEQIKEPLNSDRLNDLIYEILVFIFNLDAIKIEEAAINENNNKK